MLEDSQRFDRYSMKADPIVGSIAIGNKPMRDYQSLSHTRWDCKYHVVFIPKKRKKVIFGTIRTYLGDIFHELAKMKGIEIVEGHLMRDHVHMCISIPPKFAVSQVVGFLKGKSAIGIAKRFKGRQRNFSGEHFWARGYFVSTVGLDEAMVREYIRNQEKEDEYYDQISINI